MINKGKIVKFTSVFVLTGALCASGIVIANEKTTNHSEEQCILGNILGIEHRIDKIKEDRDVVNVSYVDKEDTYTYIDGDDVEFIEGPAIIVDRVGVTEINGRSYMYDDTRCFNLDEDGNSYRVDYLEENYVDKGVARSI